MSHVSLQNEKASELIGTFTDRNPQTPVEPDAMPEAGHEDSQPSALQQKRRRRLLLLIAAGLLLLALVWRFLIDRNGVEGQMIRALQAHGYTIAADDLYPAAAYGDTSIRALLPDTALENAVAASQAAGFPSDIDRTGQIVLYMTALSNQDVITLFVIDRDVELAFVQVPNSDTVYPLWEE